MVITKFLLSTFTAANTGQFVVLSGPTGVGKTSMVTTFATVLGAGCGVVPVRPAWIDPTDLLGFYNPQQKRYQPSPFMDRFIEAQKFTDHNRLYFLALDEMNLSRVENYAADFLSRLEKARNEEKGAKINLYSIEIERYLREEEKKREDLDKFEYKEQLALISHLEKYPANMSIPEGLVMFGTINLDETTYHLSPKFLDRSFVINIPHQNLLTDIFEIGISSLFKECIFDVSLASVRSFAHRSGREEVINDIWNDFHYWKEHYLDPLGIKPGFRYANMFLHYMNVASNLGITNYYDVACTFFQAKLLPWISFHKEDQAIGIKNRTKFNILQDWIEDNRLEKYADDYGLRKDLERIYDKGSSSLIVQYLD
jgi:RNA-directed DNA polymerase